ncbi:hypothetical protein ACJJTC_001979 [Scirpophaga incertulas]
MYYGHGYGYGGEKVATKGWRSIRHAKIRFNLRVRVNDYSTQRPVLGAHDARAVLVRGQCGRAAHKPRGERGVVCAHHAHGASAGAADAPPDARITRPDERTRATDSSSLALLSSPWPLSSYKIYCWNIKL